MELAVRQAAAGRCDFLEATGGSWKHPDGTYTFLERSPDLTDEPHDRLRPGINHLALTVADLQTLDALRADAAGYGWSELYADKYPHAGGDDHVALYLENSEGFEVEVVVEAGPVVGRVLTLLLISCWWSVA